jgi:hypothetical protein
MGSIEAALEDLNSLEPGEQPNYTFFAKKHNVNRVTLSRRHQGIQGTRAAHHEEQQLLTNQQEKTLVKEINRLSGRGLYISTCMLRNFAWEISRKEPGKNWASRFLKRHENDLVYRYTTGIDSARKRADSAFKYTLYFELLAKKIDEYNIQPSNIYNMDEKGFLIGILSKAKRIFSKRQYEMDGLQQRLQDGNREWITTIACICADGTSLSPGLIYQAA